LITCYATCHVKGRRSKKDRSALSRANERLGLAFGAGLAARSRARGFADECRRQSLSAKRVIRSEREAMAWVEALATLRAGHRERGMSSSSLCRAAAGSQGQPCDSIRPIQRHAFQYYGSSCDQHHRRRPLFRLTVDPTNSNGLRSVSQIMVDKSRLFDVTR